MVTIGVQIFIDRTEFDNTNTTTYPNIIKKAMLHEIGHTMGMGDYAGSSGNSVMNNYNPAANSNGVKNDPNNFNPVTVKECDRDRIALNPQCILPRLCSNSVPPNFADGSCNSGYVANANGYCCPAPDPYNPEPFCAEPVWNLSGGTCSGGYGNGWIEDSGNWGYCCCLWGCTSQQICGSSGCISPISIDTLGNGFDLTNASGGVQFDITDRGTPMQISWTSAGSDDAWLVLDRNGNGTIDSGAELFGNFTPQPEPAPGEERNGFLALTEFDKPANGGNNDGKITKKDDVFTNLRLWRDVNHNGVSEPSELFTLPELGLRKMHLDYESSNRTDEHGNAFKYRAKVKDAQDAQLGRWAWDVYLIQADQLNGTRPNFALSLFTTSCARRG